MNGEGAPGYDNVKIVPNSIRLRQSCFYRLLFRVISIFLPAAPVNDPFVDTRQRVPESHAFDENHGLAHGLGRIV